MNCHQCNNKLIEGASYCPYCGAHVKENREFWKTKIMNDAYWFDMQQNSNFPYILRNEYMRIKNLIDAGQTYGAVLQLKDVYEIALKLPTLIGIANIYNKPDKTEEEFITLENALEKELSLGNWYKVMKKVNDVITEMDLKEIYEQVIELWDWRGRNSSNKERKKIGKYNDFIHWRNSTIGHGALAYDDNIEYQETFELILLRLKEYFHKCESIYAKYPILIKESNKTISLNHVNWYERTIDPGENLVVEIDGKDIKLYPFILIFENGFYLFDSYLYGKRKYDTLCYTNGKKVVYNREKRIQKLIEQCYSEILQSHRANDIKDKFIKYRHSIEDEWHRFEDEINIETAFYQEKFYDVDYLDEWLLNKLESPDDKIFLLLMDGGMGKSAWCRGYDSRFNPTPKKIKDYTIKNIYINNSYHSNTDSVLTAIADAVTLRSDNVKGYIQDVPRTINRKAVNKRQELVDFLEFYRLCMYNSKEWENEKLLLIIDGLDELNEDKELYEWLPSDENLTNNIRLLLTSRPHINDKGKILVPDIIQKNVNIKFNNQKIVRNTDEVNKTFLYKCAISKINSSNATYKLDENEINSMIKSADYNFLRLKMYLVVFNKNKQISLNDLYSLYVKEISGYYCEKYLENLYKILGIMAMLPAPITIRELGQILGHEKPDYMMLSYLNDFDSWLLKEHKNGQTYISICNSEISNYILTCTWFDQNQYIKMIMECLTDASYNILNTIQDISKVELFNSYRNYSGALYVLQYSHLINGFYSEIARNDNMMIIANAWCDILNSYSGIMIDIEIEFKQKYMIYKNLYEMLMNYVYYNQKDATSVYFVIHLAFLRVVLLDHKYEVFRNSKEIDINLDIKMVEKVRSICLDIENIKEDNVACNIYDRLLLIYPIYLFEISMILNIQEKEEQSYEYISQAIIEFDNVLEEINGNSFWNEYDYNMIYDNYSKAIVNILLMNAGKKLDVDRVGALQEKLKEINKKLGDIEGEYFYLYQLSCDLYCKLADYKVKNDEIVYHELLKMANNLLEQVMKVLENPSINNREKLIYVSYLGPVVSVYVIRSNKYRNTNDFEKNMKSFKMELENACEVFDIYRQYGYISRNMETEIYTLVKLGYIYLKENKPDMMTRAYEKALVINEDYQNQLFYNESIDHEIDKFSLYVSLGTQYAANPKNLKKALSMIKKAQDIYNKNSYIKEIHKSDKMVLELMKINISKSLELSSNFTDSSKQLYNTKQKIPRNAQCPCGSGKKYKLCCGK